jgi:hypothetical protein
MFLALILPVAVPNTIAQRRMRIAFSRMRCEIDNLVCLTGVADRFAGDSRIDKEW